MAPDPRFPEGDPSRTFADEADEDPRDTEDEVLPTDQDLLAFDAVFLPGPVDAR